MLLSSISKMCFSNIYSKTLEVWSCSCSRKSIHHDPDHQANHLKKINQLVINQVYFIPKQVRIPRVGHALLKEALPQSLKTSRSSLYKLLISQIEWTLVLRGEYHPGMTISCPRNFKFMLLWLTILWQLSFLFTQFWLSHLITFRSESIVPSDYRCKTS